MHCRHIYSHIRKPARHLLHVAKFKFQTSSVLVSVSSPSWTLDEIGWHQASWFLGRTQRAPLDKHNLKEALCVLFSCKGLAFLITQSAGNNIENILNFQPGGALFRNLLLSNFQNWASFWLSFDYPLSPNLVRSAQCFDLFCHCWLSCAKCIWLPPGL